MKNASSRSTRSVPENIRTDAESPAELMQDMPNDAPCIEHQLTWFPHEVTMPRNTDFAERVVARPSAAAWEPTRIPGVAMRLLEYIPGTVDRVTAQLRLETSVVERALCTDHGVELFVQRGELEMLQGVYPAGLYLRLPLNAHEPVGEVCLRAGTECAFDPGFDSGEGEAALLYVSTGQFAETDTEQRRINARDEAHWLPGPIEGTDVLPLHGHGSDNAMLIRWSAKVAFQPRLDPTGEEVLVLRGQLHDAEGSYPAGTWIRNPLLAWQSWGGEEGTVIYYKNGHFLATADAANGESAEISDAPAPPPLPTSK